jgi:hypothetical protein
MTPRTFTTSLAVACLSLAWTNGASSDHDLGPRPVIDGEFKIQPYELPGGQGYRHLTSMINEARKELVLFGGLGDGPPFPPTPMNHNVYTLDLKKRPSEQEWELRSTDDVIPEPWFTTTRGFVQLGERTHLACDDSEVNGVYAFDPKTYSFELVSESTLPPQFNTSDCCALGVTLRDHRDPGGKEERIYFVGGGNEFASPVPYVRYYSITHDRWERVADLNVSRRHAGCASVKRRGKPLLYAIAGGNEMIGEALRSIEVYDVINDKWTLYEDFLPESGGRTRMSVQSVDDDFLLVIGGDASCTGGLCPEGRPISTVDVIDIRSGNELISSEEHLIPQLNSPRQTPATSLWKRSGRGHKDRYVLHVVGGQTVDPDDEEDGTDVLTTTEVLTFDRIKVPPKRHRGSSEMSSLR